MNLEELREFASAVGVLCVHHFDERDTLIRTIQLEIGTDDCFNSPEGCPDPKRQCLWEAECACRHYRAA